MGKNRSTRTLALTAALTAAALVVFVIEAQLPPLTAVNMHLDEVAVPVRTQHKQIGNAHVVCARTRAKFVGGSRAVYDEALL